MMSRVRQARGVLVRATKSKSGIGVAGFVVGLLVCLLTDIEQFSFDPTGGIDFQTRAPTDIEHFRSVRSDPDRWMVYVSLLAEEDVYAANDRRIVDAIAGLCDPIPNDPLDAYLTASEACAEQPVPMRLRQLAQQQSPPFHPVGLRVTVGVPSPNDQPRPGEANTCQNGNLYRRNVLLINPVDGTRQVEVQASGHYGLGICRPFVGTADIQLNEEDAFSIFDGPLDRLEEALAIVN